MRSTRSGKLFAVAVLLVATTATCKKSEETVAPTPDAGAPVATAPPATDQPAATPPPATPPPTTPAQPAPATAAKADAGAKTDAGAATAPTATGTAASGTNKFQNCVQKCGAQLQACLAPAPSDGGLPKIGDPTQCNKVAEACRSACTQ